MEAELKTYQGKLAKAEAAKKAALEKADEEQKTHEDELRGWRLAAEGNIKPEQLTEAESKLADANTRLTRAQADLATADSKAKDFETKLKAVEKRLVPNEKNRWINILSVEYGGRAYSPEKDAAVFKKLYEAAEKNKNFTADNDFFGEDPWSHHCKSWSITYQLNSEGAPKHLYGREHDKACFN